MNSRASPSRARLHKWDVPIPIEIRNDVELQAAKERMAYFHPRVELLDSLESTVPLHDVAAYEIAEGAAHDNV
jgi:hypothetical protein